jgi:hypothetical protein
MFIGNLKVLLLSNNYIDNVNGLDRLYSLERLSLDNNQLVNLSDISTLAKLPNLEQLSLLGNPMVTQGKREWYFVFYKRKCPLYNDKAHDAK